MKQLTAALLLMLAGSGPVLAQDDPVSASRPLDSYGRQQLLGSHKLGVQWIGWGDLDLAGSVEITEAGDVLAVIGQQVQGEDRLDIAGHITGLVDEGFVFEGAITLQGSSSEYLQPCVRSGRMHFTTRGIRQYWRLQQMASPCGQQTDYVDIYFRGI